MPSDVSSYFTAPVVAEQRPSVERRGLGDEVAEGGQETVVLGCGAVADADVARAAEGGAGADGDVALGETGDHRRFVVVAEVDPGEVGLRFGGLEAEGADALLDSQPLGDRRSDSEGDVGLVEDRLGAGRLGEGGGAE